ncbi:MAG: LPS export ABC transporter periplasmic protein LptC [Nitrosomonas sp.]|nr:LPS export ABC transporter periplasmic protein LptC [Nitrosomonas sp.]
MIRSYMLRPAIWLVGLLLLTILLEGFFQKQSRQGGSVTRSGADYIIEHLEGIQSNYDATADRRFAATRMTHYPQEDNVLLEQVRFTNIEADKPLLRVTADQAELLAGGDDIFLSGNVLILRGEDADKDLIRMMTEFLHITPDADLAKTDHAVVVFRMNSIVNSVGMILNNETGEIQLQSRVNADDQRGGGQKAVRE